ncbi:S9 family peptidase [Embleya scabrispora]|uniref:S9 family peptidase n=1 Tax=Embleya scabrispora TaxID=159449 RepID=UPI0003691BB2|nr:prolyl oligopeptidase family serine peptidase [Embleya scabrispora]MYS79470.1 prolyl oligopeptidase family serine peptidase [Streptomyces sp. SID5474]
MPARENSAFDATATATEPQTPTDAPPPPVPAWERRYRAARIGLPRWADHAPAKSVFVSNASGTFEVYAWDRVSGAQRQVTDRPNGTSATRISPDGHWIWWFADTDGDELGVWMRQPFDGGPDEVAVPGLEPSYPGGLGLANDGTVVVGRMTDDEGSTIHVARPGAEPVTVYRHTESAWLSALSEDGTHLAIAHNEHGDAMHASLRVLRLDGTHVADLHDGPEGGQPDSDLSAMGFSPVAGDQRVLVIHQRRGRDEPLLWEPLTGVETELDLGLPGDLSADWYPDGRALLIDHEQHGRSELYRYDLASEELTRIDTPPGTIGGAGARPDGSVEYHWSSGSTPSELRSTSGDVLLTPPGERPPGSVPVSDAWVEGPGGKVHALVSKPAGEGPFPTVFNIHGGPTAHDGDHFAADVAAWVDHGFAVVRVNYRGSTGYGKDWTDALRVRIGLIELEDIGAVREWAVESGLADPERIVLSGGSWGGYLTLLGLGVQPDAWALGLAAVPVADYVTAYHDEMDVLKAMDRTLLGGTPEEVPERWAASSPLTYVEKVRVPVYISAGENDPRCPIKQIENYVARLAELGKPHEVYRYDAGHGSLVVEERIRQLRKEFAFVDRVIGLPIPNPA